MKTVYPPTNTVCGGGGGINMSRVMGKPAFCICDNKAADQMHSNSAADQRLGLRYIVQSSTS